MSIRINGSDYDPETVQEVNEILDEPLFNRVNPDSSRTSGSESIIQESDLKARFGRQYDGDRNVYDVLGYDKSPDFEAYEKRYERQDIAQRVVDLPANDTWRKRPEITSDNAEFEDGFERLSDSVQLFHYLKRWDQISGIGEYGLLYVGYADGQPIDEPVNPGALESLDPEAAVSFLSPFSQGDVEEWDLGRETGLEPTDERYNKPVYYYIDFGEIDGDTRDEDIEKVHHTRIHHFAEGALTSDLKGRPRLKPILNRLYDREKIVGASAEMFWSGADRKLVFNVDPEKVANVPQDRIAELSEDAERLVHDMQQHMNAYGMDVQVIDGQEPDPSGALEAVDQSISAATGIPQNKLVGNEMGDRATLHDRKNWFDQVMSRQETTAEPRQLRPVIDRWQEFNVLPDAEYEVNWKSLFELTEVEQSEVFQNFADGINKIAPNGSTDLLPGGLEAAIEAAQSGEWPEDTLEDNPQAANVDESDPEVQAFWEDV